MNIINLTDLELNLLYAVAKGMDNSFEGYLIYLDNTIDSNKLSGVVSSLVKKGLITSDNGFNDFGSAWIEATESGKAEAREYWEI